MKEKKGKHITEFKEGDLIYKVKPTFIPQEWAKNDLTGKMEPVRGIYDRSFTDYVMKYRGIKDNKIYLEFTEDIGLEGETTKVNYDTHKDGWEKEGDPEEDTKKNEGRMLNKNDAQKFLDDLIRDNYMN